MFSSRVAVLLIGLSVSDLSTIFQFRGIASISDVYDQLSTLNFLFMSANGKVLPVGPNISDTLIIP